MYDLTTEIRAKRMAVQNLQSDKTGLFYATIAIGEANVTPRECDGVYMFVGIDPIKVNNAAQNFSSVSSVVREQNDPSIIYPKCTVFKFTGKISQYSDFIDLKNKLDFINLIFNKYNKPVPDTITYDDFKVLWDLYDQRNTTDVPEFKKQIEEQIIHRLNILSSEYATQEEYETKTGEEDTIVGFNKKLYDSFKKKNEEKLKPTTYNSKSPNCVKEITSLIRHGEKITSMNVDEKKLKAIEEELSMYPEIKYWINPVGIPKRMGDEVVNWHMVSFPSNESICQKVCAIVHKHELGFQDRSKLYFEGDLETAYSVPILLNDVDQFTKYFKEANIEFYLDVNGIYQSSDPNTVGIVVEDVENYKKMLNIIQIILDAKREGTLIEEQDFKIANKLKENTLQKLKLLPVDTNLILPTDSKELQITDKSKDR